MAPSPLIRNQTIKRPKSNRGRARNGRRGASRSLSLLQLERLAVEQSLAWMKTDYLDVVQFHSSPSRQTLEEHGALEALLELKAETARTRARVDSRTAEPIVRRTLRWRRESSCELVSVFPNSLLAGKKQGISSILASIARICGRKRPNDQYLTSKFPTEPNRELIGPHQGIKWAYQGGFLPDQGRVPWLGFPAGPGQVLSKSVTWHTLLARRSATAMETVLDNPRPTCRARLLPGPGDIMARAHLPAFDIAAIWDDAVAP